jgi:5S rRNA maturation endonuclease (ribonuclease M5)
MHDFNSAPEQHSKRDHGFRIDVADIRSRLNASAREFVGWLFSGRALITRNGHEARIGDVDGTAGTSLQITLTGVHAGLWCDHGAGGEGGDLFDLYREYMGYPDGDDNFLSLVAEVAREVLHDKIEWERPARTSTPREIIEQKKKTLGDKPRDEDVEILGAPVAIYDYYDLQNVIVARVQRFELDGVDEFGKRRKTFRPHCFKEVDGKKKWVTGAPESARPLYRLLQISKLQATNAQVPAIILVEGEKCADALATVGIEATSAMSGAEAPIEKTDWSVLKGRTVVVWPDADEPGYGWARRVSAHLIGLGCTVLGVDPPADVRKKWDSADCIAEGGDPRALIGAAKPFAGEPLSSSSPISAKPFVLRDPALIPQREWLYGKHFIRKFGSATIALGGVGKPLGSGPMLPTTKISHSNGGRADDKTEFAGGSHRQRNQQSEFRQRRAFGNSHRG